MNYAEYIIGLGAGIVISMTIRLITDGKKEKLLKENKRRNQITENFNDLDKRIIDSYCKLVSLESKVKVIVDRIDQHAGRIEKLESENEKLICLYGDVEKRTEKLESKKR